MLVDMSYYNEQSLPPELFNHTQITRLLLRAHGLSHLSPAIGQLHNLLQLDLCSHDYKEETWHSKLDRLPDSICQLSKLVHLDLSFNGLSRIPSGINRLVSLQYLNLSNNQLKDVPKVLYRLRYLQFLSLRHNGLSYIDRSVGRLRALTQLDIGENMIDEIPETIGNCVMISVLLLDSLQITEIPETVTKIASLTMIELSNNKHLESIPRGLEKLTHLTAVHIPNCHASLAQSPGVQGILSVVNKNKTSELVDTMAVKQLPVAHEFDVSINRTIEMVDIDRPQ